MANIRVKVNLTPAASTTVVTPPFTTNADSSALSGAGVLHSPPQSDFDFERDHRAFLVVQSKIASSVAEGGESTTR